MSTRIALIAITTMVGVGGVAFTGLTQAADDPVNPEPRILGATDAPALTAASFNDPPAATRPKYRWWMPAADTTDQELSNELQQMADVGAGGAEVSPFKIPGLENTVTTLLADDGWMSPAWLDRVKTMYTEARDKGLILDQTLAPHGANVPAVPVKGSLNNLANAQKLVYTNKILAPGAAFDGTLPANYAPALPQVVSTVCTPAAAGDTNVKVVQSGGYGVGDSITIDSGASAETVTITDVGDSTAPCTSLLAPAHAGDANLKVKDVLFKPGQVLKVGTESATIASVGTAGATGTGLTLATPLTADHATGDAAYVGALGSGISFTPPLTKAHAPSASITDVATKKLLAIDVAQCATTCATAPRQLVQSTVQDVSAKLKPDGTLDWTPPSDGKTWAVLGFYQTADGHQQPDSNQNARNYTGLSPDYDVDMLSTTGEKLVENYWNANVFTPQVQSIVDGMGANGTGSLFIDSYEFSTDMKWTSDMAQQWQQENGYPLATALPALAFSANGASALGTAQFDFAGTGTRIRNDYRQTYNDLHVQRFLKPLTTWAESRHLTSRAQPYNGPVDSSEASSVLGIPEGEGLAFNHNPAAYAVISVGAHMSGEPIVSTECCAGGNKSYMSTTAGAGNNLDSVYKAYAGGVNQLVWHGFDYLDAPLATWPGYHAWSTASQGNDHQEAHGPRQPWFTDYRQVNDNFGRLQLVLRQGKPRYDMAVYRYNLGSSNRYGGLVAGTIGTTSAMASAGYTYEFLSPAFLRDPKAVFTGGRLFPQQSAYKGLILNNEASIPLDVYQKIEDLAANHGMPLVIIGNLPTTVPGQDPDGTKDAAVAALSAQLTALAGDGTHKVAKVADEAAVPAALSGLGISPDDAHRTTSSAILGVHREAADTDYYYLYNQTAAAVANTVTLKGTGVPYTLDSWTGKITPLTSYTTGEGTITVPLKLAANDQTVIAISRSDLAGAGTPLTHATGTTADSVAYGAGQLKLRASQPGTYTTQLADGRSVDTSVADVPAPTALSHWTLNVQSWRPAADVTATDNVTHIDKVDLPPVTVDAAANGTLPSWSTIPALQDVSGIGTYTTTVDVGPEWTGGHGAYLELGGATNTVNVTVNGTKLPPLDQQDKSKVDVGPYLVTGANTIQVTVATTLLDAVRVAPGDGAWASRARQATGLFGPVRLVPYGEAAVFASTSATGTAATGTVPATLALTLGGPASFGAFTPGVAKDYSASTTADVVSTAGDAALSVSDPGHLANGAFSLPSPLEVSLSKTSWSAPVSHDPVTIAFKQHVGETDALRTGSYSRTLTFTLSTTTP